MKNARIVRNRRLFGLGLGTVCGWVPLGRSASSRGIVESPDGLRRALVTLIMLTGMDMIMMAGIGLVRLMVPTDHGFAGLFLGRPCGTA